MVSYQNEAHLVHEFFFRTFSLAWLFFSDIFPCMTLFSGHFPLHDSFFRTFALAWLFFFGHFPLHDCFFRTFSLAWIFFGFFPTPPHHFSNGSVSNPYQWVYYYWKWDSRWDRKVLIALLSGPSGHRFTHLSNKVTSLASIYLYRFRDLQYKFVKTYV